MFPPIIYCNDPWTISNDKLIYGTESNSTICDYIIDDDTIRFLNNGVLHIIELKNNLYVIDGNMILFSRKYDNYRPLNLYCFPRNITSVVFDKDHDEDGIESIFNCSIILTPNITIGIFGDRYNQPIFLTRYITVLSFGKCFNQPIVLSKYIKVLSFGAGFNQPIILTRCIKDLTVCYSFTEPIILTSKIVRFKMGFLYNIPLRLSSKITHLIFGHRFNQPILLNKKLRVVSFKNWIYQHIVLTSQIIDLEVGSGCKIILDNLPNGVKNIHTPYTKQYMSNAPNDMI